jgi:hypothetical protein
MEEGGVQRTDTQSQGSTSSVEGKTCLFRTENREGMRSDEAARDPDSGCCAEGAITSEEDRCVLHTFLLKRFLIGRCLSSLHISGDDHPCHNSTSGGVNELFHAEMHV